MPPRIVWCCEVKPNCFDHEMPLGERAALAARRHHAARKTAYENIILRGEVAMMVLRYSK